MPPRKTSSKKPKTTPVQPRLVGGEDDIVEPRVLRPCVVLAQASQPLDETLHAALHEAGLTPRVEHDPRMAMAEVCLLRREARQRRGAGGDQDEPAPLVLTTTQQQEVDGMLAAMQKHVPDIPILRFDGAALVSVHASTPEAAPPLVVNPSNSPELTDDELATLLSADGSPSAKPWSTRKP
ncbi:MAG: hypothetical protein GY894_01030 [Planctomycetes bacterium]|nr:hypothetical protein [Planctomycetota bacterium]MCP4837932.1 hypothetical protein [Planctomycetota bacterium]